MLILRLFNDNRKLIVGELKIAGGGHMAWRRVVGISKWVELWHNKKQAGEKWINEKLVNLLWNIMKGLQIYSGQLWTKQELTEDRRMNKSVT